MSEEITVRIAGKSLSPRWLLTAIVILYVLLVGLYGWLTPYFEGPDEPQHYAYIEWLAEGKGFPPQGEAAYETDIEQEAGQPPLYYLLASIPARLIGVTNPPVNYTANPHFPGVKPRLHWLGGLFPPLAADNDNNATPLPAEEQPLQGGWLALRAARLLSLAFGILLLGSVYGLGRQVAPRDPGVALAATLLVAVTPQVIFISSVASNDIPAAALSSLTLWLLAVQVRQGPRWPGAFFAGAAFGLALLTKVSTVALALPIAAALAWLWLSGRQKLSQVIRVGLVMVLGAFLVAGWWFIRTTILYGSPTGMGTHDLTPWSIAFGPLGYLATPFARWQDVYRSFWISLGWGTIRPATWIYQVLVGAGVVGLIGLLLAAYRGRRKPGQQLTRTVMLLLILVLTIIGVAIGLEIWMRRVVASYGRLMFPAVAAIAILLVVGWRAIHRRLPVVAIGFVALLAIVAPFWLLGPAFAEPRPAAPEIAKEAAGWFYGASGQPIAELLSARSMVDTAVAEDVVPVQVCWRVIRQSQEPLSVLVHFIGPENALAANRRSYPGMGNYPTNLWQPGYRFCDLMPVYVDRLHLQESLLYKVEIAMLDEEQQARLPIHDGAGNEIPVAFVDEVQLLLGQEDERRIVYAPEPDSGEPFQLLAHEMEERWQRGQTHNVTLTWGVNEDVDQDYQVFVHLRDAASGEIVAQGDGPPAGGWHPTSWWITGLGVIDEHSVHIAEDLAPGQYRMVVGFYDLATGQRVGREYDLGQVAVVQ